MTSTPRRLTKSQLAKALVEVDAKLAQARAVVAFYLSTYGETFRIETDADLLIADAWNAAHDAVTALESHRARVEANPVPITAATYESHRLAFLNID